MIRFIFFYDSHDTKIRFRSRYNLGLLPAAVFTIPLERVLKIGRQGIASAAGRMARRDEGAYSLGICN